MRKKEEGKGRERKGKPDQGKRRNKEGHRVPIYILK
jgi:hypothetical protein